MIFEVQQMAEKSIFIKTFQNFQNMNIAKNVSLDLLNVER